MDICEFTATLRINGTSNGVIDFVYIIAFLKEKA